MPLPLALFTSLSLSSPPFTKMSPSLYTGDLTKIALLIPRLCNSDHLSTAVRLAAAALSTAPSPSLSSLSLSVLVDRLTAQPHMTDSMAFLNRLKHNSTATLSLLPIGDLIIRSYFRKRKGKEALKVYNWMVRPDSICIPNSAIYGVLASGFCANGMILEGLKVLREMIRSNSMVGTEVRIRVFRGLLREARVLEGVKLNEALAEIGDGYEDVEKAVKLIDEIISKWED